MGSLAARGPVLIMRPRRFDVHGPYAFAIYACDSLNLFSNKTLTDRLPAPLSLSLFLPPFLLSSLSPTFRRSKHRPAAASDQHGRLSATDNRMRVCHGGSGSGSGISIENPAPVPSQHHHRTGRGRTCTGAEMRGLWEWAMGAMQRPKRRAALGPRQTGVRDLPPSLPPAGFACTRGALDAA